jgi:predicted dehydrogenase
VAFLDATHFTHHPRTAQLKRERQERIGTLEAVQSVFFFPNNDRANIRFDATKEPTGAIGDMAWYSMRAAAEFLPEDAVPVRVSAEGTKDPVTGTWVRSAGCIRFSNGSTTTWDAGFTVGSLVMDLSLFGSGGSIHMDDYVLDWAGGMLGADRNAWVGFVQRNGPATPASFQRVATPSPTRQAVRMVEHLARLARDPRGPEATEAIRLAERTQGMVDLVAEAVGRA